MKPANSRAAVWCDPVFYAVFLPLLLLVSVAEGQLAITEVMSFGRCSDYWELTNLGTEGIDLSGYRFTDKGNTNDLACRGLTIGPGQSIVFFRLGTGTTPDELTFRDHWRLPADRVVRSFSEFRLSSAGESLLVFDHHGTLIDEVSFPFADYFGFSFIYNPDSGSFDKLSLGGDCEAMQSVDADVGSPGTNCGRLAIQITDQPTNLVTTPGRDATFYVRAIGIPHPRYQWRFNGQPLPCATGTELCITNVRPLNAGAYDVEVTNGVDIRFSVPATLTVDTNRSPPKLIKQPKDCILFVGQSARFIVVVSGYPPPALQWFTNGTAMLGETNLILRVPNCQAEMAGWVYCLQACNELGSASACARLIVTNRPDLRITEAMARRPPEQDSRPHKDWFEVTNFGTDAVDLSGYRFICSEGGRLDIAREVPDGLVIRSGESIIFADFMSREEFTAWWGKDNVPEELQVVTWTAFGINPYGGVNI